VRAVREEARAGLAPAAFHRGDRKAVRRKLLQRMGLHNVSKSAKNICDLSVERLHLHQSAISVLTKQRCAMLARHCVQPIILALPIGSPTDPIGWFEDICVRKGVNPHPFEETLSLLFTCPPNFAQFRTCRTATSSICRLGSQRPYLHRQSAFIKAEMLSPKPRTSFVSQNAIALGGSRIAQLVDTLLACATLWRVIIPQA